MATIQGLLRSRWVGALVAPRSVDDYLSLIAPDCAVHEVRARVLEVRQETREAVSLWLRPNAVWRGFVPGQFVRVSVAIDGVRYDRCFSISSAPRRDGAFRLTIKVWPGGRVSGWAQHRARAGNVVTLSQALGQFVLPDPVPPKILCISGGSGITPLLSMVTHVLASGHEGRITCLHYARQEIIGGDALRALAANHANFHFLPQRTDHAVSGPGRHFSLAQLESLVPDWRDYETFLCGPESLQRAVTQLWDAEGCAQPLHVERFEMAAAPPPTDAAAARHTIRIHLAKTGRIITGDGVLPLLDQAERTGLRPPHGCRMGVCHHCKCTKHSGVVRNRLTGEVDAEPGRSIQLCVTTPLSDVSLDL